MANRVASKRADDPTAKAVQYNTLDTVQDRLD